LDFRSSSFARRIEKLEIFVAFFSLELCTIFKKKKKKKESKKTKKYKTDFCASIFFKLFHLKLEI